MRMMDSVNILNPNTLLLGDFNINLLVKQPAWETLICSVGLTQVLNQPTRVTNTSSTLIDHIYTSDRRMLVNASVVQTAISDHFPVICTLSFGSTTKLRKGHTYVHYRTFKNFHKDHFLLDLSKCQFEHVSNCSDPEDAARAFLNIFLPVIDKHAPIRKKRVKHPNLPTWMTSDIMSAMKIRDQLKKDKQFDAYKKQRNRVTMMIRFAKKDYFSKLIAQDKSTSQLWRAMNALTNATKQKHSPTTNSFSADEYNNFFLSQVHTIIPPDSPTSSFTSTSFATKLSDFCDSKLDDNDEFCIPPMTVSEVTRYVLHLKNKRSLDYNNLNSSLLKLSLPYTVDSLTYIYNLCISKNSFPTFFKIAKVIPIPKSKDINTIDNYRPISILSILSKPIERHVHNHLMRYMEERNLFHIYQSGFRPKHSCTTALIRLCNTWLNALNEHNTVGTVFLDLRRAFDLVDHGILVEKLHCYLRNPSTTSFFMSYLANRKQAVYHNGSVSNIGTLTCGVPQGSILGPLLFCIFINDLPLHLNHIDVSLDLFADDSSLHCMSKEVSTIQNILQKSVNVVNNWCSVNKMALHPLKSKCMLITTRQKYQLQPLPLNLYLDSNKIEQVQEHKVLGVIIDAHLSWSSHVNYICKRLSQNVFLLSKLRFYVDITALKTFFFCTLPFTYQLCICCLVQCCRYPHKTFDLSSQESCTNNVSYA